jgi:hypothetical protein
MAAMLVFMMCPAGTGLALARRHARAVPAARDDVPVRLLPPWDDPNGITPWAETSSNARWMRFHPALKHRELAEFRPRADDVPASVSHSPAPAQPSEGPAMLPPHRHWKDPITAVIGVAFFAGPPLAAAVAGGGTG